VRSSLFLILNGPLPFFVYTCAGGGIDRSNYKTQDVKMKKLFVPTAAALSALLLLTGCLALQVGGGDKKEERKATIGRQMIDLKAARDSGAITEAEYEAQKAKVLGEK
jgi:Short C-terminal domain